MASWLSGVDEVWVPVGLTGVAGLVACILLCVAPVVAQDTATAGLYSQPVLVLDPGMHTAAVTGADVDAAGRYAVTGSSDKTVRVWSVTDGRLLRTIRLPSGPGNVGKVYTVAISPDGDIVAVGGWTRWSGAFSEEQIYVFDRKTGALLARIDGLPQVVLHLTFSPNGRHLAATLGGSNGLRVYSREAGWAEVARDMEYGDSSHRAAFAPDGWLATTSLDGRIRLYNRSFELMSSKKAINGQQPDGLAFSPDGRLLAIGYADTTAVDLLNGSTLEPLMALDTAGIHNGNLSRLSWSADGQTLWAGGQYDRGDGVNPILAWKASARGGQEALMVRAESYDTHSYNTIVTLTGLRDGGLLVAAADPHLSLLGPAGTERWVQRSRQPDFRYQEKTLAISKKGAVVDFGFDPRSNARARFNLETLSLRPDPPEDGSTLPPRTENLVVEEWEDTYRPTLEGVPLPLGAYEVSRSLAIHPDGSSFVLGSDWSLYAFDAGGEILWRQPAPGETWAANITGDGRLLVAAHGDGTIRWYRVNDGRELLSLFPLSDRKNWVAWTAEGFYAATPGAHGVLRWHINRGWDEPAEAIPISDIPQLRRPDVLPLVLQEMGTARAVGLAELNAAIRSVELRTRLSMPGARLHVLTIGISDYGGSAELLRLSFADSDARDVASALVGTQGSLYADVVSQSLQNEQASKPNILRALHAMRQNMAEGQGRDLAVVAYSGHGAVVDNRPFLLPYGISAQTLHDIQGGALPIDDLHHELRELSAHGRVLLLLDVVWAAAGDAMALDTGLLRSTLRTDNVTVLTSTSGREASLEREEWRNSAFTEAFLDALGGDADMDRDALISTKELTAFLSNRLPRLTDGMQTAGIEIGFDENEPLFASGL